MSELLTLFIPFLGTSLGSAMVYLLRNNIANKLERALLGFAAGIMIAASVWSLLIPAIDMAEQQNVIPWLPAAAGFALGILFLWILDNLIPHQHLESEESEGLPSKLKKTYKMVLAVTIHNIPEGMAVGVAYAGALSGNSTISTTAALALSLGIAIQNFPEGAIISMPLRSEGVSKNKAFLYGVLSGAVEPLFGWLTILFVSKVIVVLPYLLAFAAGAMMYVVIEELIPESQAGKHSDIGTLAAACGFVLMMILDVALG